MNGPVDRHIFEELGLNAWPAFSSLYFDQWLLTFNAGFTYRANTVYPFGQSSLPLTEKIDYCEALYWERGLPCVFKIYDENAQGMLDSALAVRGYKRDDPAAIMTMLNLESIPKPKIAVKLTRRLSRRWLAAYFGFSGREPAHIPIMARMMAQQLPDQRYARIEQDGHIVAAGRAVLDRGWVGIYNLATAPEARGRGYARSILNTLLTWGRQEGAISAYLQVGVTNAPAMHLYERVGFREYYRYWFRYKAALGRH